jgi:hypothetical protein
MPAALLCYRPDRMDAEQTFWADPLEAWAALDLAPCSTRCAGLHAIVWRDARGRFRVWGCGTIPVKLKRKWSTNGDRPA